MRISDQTYGRLKLLKAIRSDGPIARTELVGRTGLAGATVSEITANLLQRGLIVEQRDPANGRGRPRVQLEINPTGGIAIAARLDPGATISAAFVDLKGDAIYTATGQLDQPKSSFDLAQRIAELLEDAIKTSPFRHTQINCVAVVLPALLDTVGGKVNWARELHLPPYPVAAAIESRLKLPVRIENYSSCMARAEHWFGRARLIENFSVFYISFGIGGAQYVDGILRVGTNGFGSEIGHVKVDWGMDAAPCACGSRGCLERYSSMLGVLLQSGRVDAQAVPEVGLLVAHMDELLAKADQGAPDILTCLDNAGRRLGIAVSDHINTFDPGLVLVLFRDPRFLEFVKPAFREALDAATFAPLLERTRVELAVSDEGWQEKGAAALALEHTYIC